MLLFRIFVEYSHLLQSNRYNLEDDFRFFGYVIGQFSEAGNFLLSELESLRGPLGLPVERDRHLTPTRLGDLVPDL